MSPLKTPLKEKNSWFFSGGSAKKQQTEEPVDQDEVVALLCHLAETITQRQSVCTGFDVDKQRFIIDTSAALRGSRVQARVLRDLNDFKRLRTELLQLLPKTRAPVVHVDSLKKKGDLLQQIPQRSMRRHSTRTAKTKDIASFSKEGTNDWFLSKVDNLTEWLKHCLSVLHPNVAYQTDDDAHHLVVKQILETLTTFLLRGATLSISTNS